MLDEWLQKEKILQNRSDREDDVLTDSDWLREVILPNNKDIKDVVSKMRFFSLVSNKISDTSMGGNLCINNKPQYTRYADIRLKGLLSSRRDVTVENIGEPDFGMGRWYGETIDDNASDCYFEFGVKEFNNIALFTLGAVDYKKAVIANSGRSPFFYNAGKLFTTGAMIIAFPIIVPLILIGKIAINLIAGKGKFDHYYLKPTMFLYWSTVNSIVTMMATELGLISSFISEESSSTIGHPLKLDAEHLANIKKIMPDLITKNNSINVHAMVSKTQKRYNSYIKNREEHIKNLSSIDETAMADFDSLADNDLFDDIKETVKPIKYIEQLVIPEEESDLWETLKEPIGNDKNYSTKKPEEGNSGSEDFKSLLKGLVSGSSDDTEGLEMEKNSDGTYKREDRREDEEGTLSNTFETMKAVFNEGAKYMVFRVDYVGSSSTTFNNSTTTVSLGDTINDLGQKWRDFKFNIGGGEVPILSDIVTAVQDLAVGTLSGVTVGMSDVVGTFLSGASIEMAKRYQDSDVTFPTHTFTADLISNSPHPIAQLTNIYIPIAVLLGPTAPLSTGPRSFTSPFLCSMFLRGTQHINLGMITSLTITAGTSNLPYNKQKRPLAFQVSFEVTDFSSVITAPVVSSLLDTSNVAYDDESGISKFVQAITARNLFDTTHVWSRSKLKLANWLANADVMLSPEYIGSLTGDYLTNNTFFSAFNKSGDVNYSENF